MSEHAEDAWNEGNADDMREYALSPDQLRWDAIIKWAHANVPDAVVAIRDLAKEVVDARDANAELLRLLERHHKESIAENRLHPADDLLYSDTELCRETEAAIKRAKEKV